MGVVGEVEYRIQISPDKVKTYNIDMLKRYFYRDNDVGSLTANKSQNNTAQNKDSVSVEQAASVACVLEDEDTEEKVGVKDARSLFYLFLFLFCFYFVYVYFLRVMQESKVFLWNRIIFRIINRRNNS